MIAPEAYAEAFAPRENDPWSERRRHAMDRFEKLGFPTTKQEDYRFTNFQPLTSHRFAPAPATTNGLAAAEVERFALAPGLVFCDGCFRPDLSHVPDGVEVADLAPEAVPLERDARTPFTALNTAFFEGGFFLKVKAGTRIEQPIHLLFAGSDKRLSSPRGVFSIEAGASARIVENYVSRGDEPHWTNAFFHVDLHPGAELEHTRLQCENPQAFHVSYSEVLQEEKSRYTSHVATLGGALVRNDLVAVLDAPEVSCTLNGVYLLAGDQHLDNHTRIEHRKPFSESHELYKGILDDRARGVFTGHIHVFPDAQKTDAFQASAGLLLGRNAILDSMPQLEIYADDVKCSHGTTIGELSEEALFYLRARGIGAEQARGMLVHAFVKEVIDRIGVPAARERVGTLLERKLKEHLDAAQG